MSDNEKLNLALRQEISAITPNRVDDLLARLGEQQPDQQPEAKRRPRSVYRGLIAAALAVVVLGGGLFYGLRSAQRSTVILDANAPVAFTVDGFDRVRSVRLENARAVSALDAEHFTGKKLEAAVADATEQLITGNVLSANENAVLLSVQEDRDARAEKLMEAASTALTAAAEKHEIAPAVLTQTVSERVKPTAGVSLGRTALTDGTGVPSDAAVLDLLYYFSSENAVPEDTQVYGTWAETAFCSVEQAVRTASDASGGTGEAASLSWDHSRLVYVVRVPMWNGDAVYTISARTGEILSAEIPGWTTERAPGEPPEVPAVPQTPSTGFVPETSTVPEQEVDPGAVYRFFKGVVDFWDAII